MVNRNHNLIRAHVVFEGKVQGVYFRAFIKKLAEEMGINGWVKNLPDGNVEAVFEGEKDILDKMIERCITEHPRAVVKNIRISWEKPENISGFSIKY